MEERLPRHSIVPKVDRIPFTLATTVGRERVYIEEALSAGALTGDGKFTGLCERWLERTLNAHRAILTPSCTAALEMASLLLDLKPGDEVIMPSFTYVSTANAFVLRGAVPVFVDVCANTLNIDETKIGAAITPRTRAIVAVHYAGEPCAMDAIVDLAEDAKLAVIEDAAQGLLSSYRDRFVGTIARFGCFSFHGTKNTTCGHGGALMVNRPEDCARADVIRDRGTDRKKFLDGDVQKYSWVDVGSSYYMSELSAAYLLAQLEQSRAVVLKRQNICRAYRSALEPLAARGHVRLPGAEPFGSGNGHIFYLLTQDADVRHKLLAHLGQHGIDAAFHYTPLHMTPAGQRFGRAPGSLPVTEDVSQTILRLPVFATMDRSQQERVIDAVLGFYA
ncbi:MAG: dTDP-4-amino-4,6-dideoxygalactose transaminase [Proteobacteria bacterium]|nr:dTDP-4-amino-4,6-dideoxygalactose transaminase [Pseudomonadota bacterium]